MKTSKLRFYRHYKNKPYKYLGEVRHSETLKELVLYEALYKNDLGKLWVRPKEMFFENIEIDGQLRPRFENVEFKIEFAEQLSSKSKTQMTGLFKMIFDNYDPDKLDSRLNDKMKVLLLSAFDKEKLVGFKIGYELDSNTFYSWLGAVDPEYRGLGLGAELMAQQHSWCAENGYESIETKTINKWQSMLHLNINSGFLITGTEATPSGELKILMKKTI